MSAAVQGTEEFPRALKHSSWRERHHKEITTAEKRVRQGWNQRQLLDADQPRPSCT